MKSKKKIPKKKAVKKKAASTVDPIEGVYSDSIKYAAESFRVGESEIAIAQKIKETYPILTDANVQFVLHKGSKLIASQFARDSKSMVSLHVRRYDKEINRLLGKAYEGLIDEDTEEDGDANGAEKRKARLITLMMCLDVMFAKEKVLQLHSKETQVRVFNKLNAKVKAKKIMFDLSSLSLQEKIEFLTLIQKAKKTDTQLFSVITNTDVTKKIVEDIEHEEVENKNIEQIVLTNLPVPIKVKQRKTLDDVTKKIHEALARKAAAQFKRKGGGNGGPKALDYTEINEL